MNAAVELNKARATQVADNHSAEQTKLRNHAFVRLGYAQPRGKLASLSDRRLEPACDIDTNCYASERKTKAGYIALFVFPKSRRK